MRYQLTIEKVEDNPKVDARDMYAEGNQPKLIFTKVLELALNEKQFVEVKKSVMEVIK